MKFCRSGGSKSLFFDQDEARRAERESLPSPPSLITWSGRAPPHPPFPQGLDPPLNSEVKFITIIQFVLYLSLIPQFT